MSLDRELDTMAAEQGTWAEDAMAMRRLAERYAPGRGVCLGLGRAELRRLETRLQSARALRRLEGAEDESLARLDGQAPAILNCARRAAAEGSDRLPGWRGRPRIEVALEALCAGGANALTRQRLISALRELDAAQPLTQAELWAVPEALRAVLSRALADAAEAIVARGRQQARAARWARAPRGRLAGRDDSFVACALKRAGEEGLPAARRQLDAYLTRRGQTADSVVAAAQSAEALSLLRLDNLTSALRLLGEMNWRDGFRALSRVEQELRGEAAGVYARMDDESRAAVRDQVAHIARRLGVPELVVARSAVDAARGCEGRQGGVCWWLYDDQGREALLEAMGRGDVRLRKLVPDPTGRRTMTATLCLAVPACALLTVGAGSLWLLPACALLGWTCAGALVGRFYSRFFPPARLLKLELDALPEDCRTLVTMPVLLSSPERAEAVCDQLEALGCLEPDENIEYLLLGDFADAPRRDMPGDAEILERARARVAAMNARAGRDRYALLCRPRTLLKPDGVWMGRDRKRGALMDLNRLLLGLDDGQATFAAQAGDCPRLRGRFTYVITLDADTRLLPDAARRLIGAMAHPLNRPDRGRGYAVLQPRMETLPSACVNAFVRLFSGMGGLNAYPICVSNLWQDMTGRGIYAGKGIYDISAFHNRLDGALPEGRVLSHDLIEGALAGAGFVGDVAFYDGGPTSLSASLTRRHRWTRGDWQLLPLLRLRGLEAADRFRMLDNLVRSLRAPALFMLLLGAVWTGSGGALLAALAVNYLSALLGIGDGDALKWRRATAELAILPIEAWNALDAALRALWRAGVSGRRLMDWVTAADAEGRAAPKRARRLPGRVAALLLLPGLLIPGWLPGTLALGTLFLIAPGWIHDMESERLDARAALSEGERQAFTRLARDTWRFFEACVPHPGGALPPDNVQSDPPVGAARRTSPTNIALYLLSCLSAHRLGFIGVLELQSRVASTLDAVERMEKWRGQLYNWYDIDTLAPLRPRYVSSVDSGNLVAALLTCGGAAELGPALSARTRALAEGMDLTALYDGERELFFIGMDVESGRLSGSHYDLLASEARLLSYAAMMLGQAPARHWQRLGRSCAQTAGGAAPLSWSGTIFEYLMPELLLAEPTQTLLGAGVRAAVRAQMAEGRRAGRPWGVSESGYCAFDAALNYQYRAFGLRALALDGDAAQDVVAPYASMLAAMVAPRAAARNLDRMRTLGWADEWGLYEAADYLRPGEDGHPALVRSHMAHHQGMILCALCNALTDDSLRADFMGLPEARALSLLLEERACTAAKPRRRTADGGPIAPRTVPRLARQSAQDALAPETHLLHGGGAAALCTDDGATHYWRDGICATRFSGVLQNRTDRAATYLTDIGTGAQIALGGAAGRASFEPGAARFAARLNRLEAELSVCVSPEDGTLLRVVRLRNLQDRPARLAVTDVVPVALCSEADWRAHAVFQCLFVESRRLDGDALLFGRRPGSRGAGGPRLIHMAAGPGDISVETDYERLAGRMGDAGSATRFDVPLAGGVGATLNPVSAIRLELELAPGQQARAVFAMNLLTDGRWAEDWQCRWRRADQPERTTGLAAARAGAMLGFIGLDAGRYHALQRMAALLVDGTLSAQARGPRRGEPGVSRERLWPLGLSGDRPILAMSVALPEQSEPVRELIRAHEFYRTAGLEVDLALLDDGEAGYARPVRDMLEAQVSASHLNCLRGTAGGVWLLDGGGLGGEERRALRRAAAATFTAQRDFYAQVRSLTNALRGRRHGEIKPMTTGASTLKPLPKLADNGFGGFVDACAYAVEVGVDRLPPAPWCDMLVGEGGGLLLSERGGGFFWRGNSRSGRLTPYGNDGLREGWGLMLYLTDGARGEALRLLPGERPQMPFRVRFDAREVRYDFETRRLAGRVRFAVHPEDAEARIEVSLENRALRGEAFSVCGFVEWLMGTDSRDSALLNCWYEGGALLATGAMDGAGYFAAADAFALSGAGRSAFMGRGGLSNPEGLATAAGGEGWSLQVPLRLRRGERCSLRFVLGWAEDVAAARDRVRQLRAQPTAPAQAERSGLIIETPDAALNALANGFLLHQARASRVLGRAGLYQPGGAWGFRDQLQDMLALMHDEPRRARAHLLRCAARQFEAGDVMHWWHEPYLGVRTRVSDDLLFLPWVTAAYVKQTGDMAILDECVAYLEDVEIPDGQEDAFLQMRPGATVGTLHEHCMRAFRRAARTGAHGLLLMGAGDWNDGMNRVGAEGRGESVWLSEFAIACADAYRPLTRDAEENAELWALSERLRQAVEAHGWDGGWYLRAYGDDGAPLGSAGNEECRIDAISQAWAVLAGLDGARCRAAMDAAWRMLADGEQGIIRLLTPPFEGKGVDPGYIRGYPAGVRENGGQYTHSALWLLLALIRMGDADRAHRALRMLLPFNHADTPDKAKLYRVEPYVMAADVYDMPGNRGRGGWTWYTGAAGWMYNCLLELLGYERRGDLVRLNALLGEWPSAAVTLPFGESRYRLVCDKKAARVTLDGMETGEDFIRLVDDGKCHEARFPHRE